MKCNEAGKDIVKRYEGCKLAAYRCPAGVWTVGYGSTLGVKEGMKITQAEAEERFKKDMAAVEKVITDMNSVPLNDNQFSALCSLTFNIGSGNYRTSTLRAMVNRKDFLEAADQFHRWVYAGGRKMAGLIERRKEERALFLKPSLVKL